MRALIFMFSVAAVYLVHIPGISIIPKQRLLIERLLRKIFSTYSKPLPFAGIML